MRHLAATETQGHLDLVAFLEESAHGFHFHVVIMVVDAGAELDLFDLDDLLPLASLIGFLLLEKSEAAVIEDLADRRGGIRGELDEIEAGILGDLEGIEEGHHTPVRTVVVDQLNLADTSNVAVDPGPIFLGRGHSSEGTANGWLLLCLFG